MIEFEYWQLLFLPVFFGLGWAAARVDIRHLVKESRALPRSYFQGLNFLLNEQPDRAIEAFVDAVKVDPQTVELHFALGSLFRRRGETERAIRMHQNLVERDDLPQDLKLQALAELGQDYLKAGLLDRAEEVFEKLRDSSMAEEAKRNLLEIYQLEKDWAKAVVIAAELPDVATQKDIAEYYCEMAAAEMIRSKPEVAAGHLRSALERNRKCVRVSLLLGDIEVQQECFAEAIACWQRIEQQDPTYLALVAKRLMDALRVVGLEIYKHRLHPREDEWFCATPLGEIGPFRSEEWALVEGVVDRRLTFEITRPEPGLTRSVCRAEEGAPHG